MNKHKKIVVIGGTGLIGKQVVSKLRQLGHEVTAASPSSGVNTVTGEGLAGALAGAEVVVDVANSPSFDEKVAMDFFGSAGKNLFAAELAAGVKHHVALSVVGTERLISMGYFNAKLLQEKLIKESTVPYTLLRATQFFEFVGTIGNSSVVGDTIRLPHALFQPMASEDVATALADIALSGPLNGMVEVAGPEPVPMDELVRLFMAVTGDKRPVVADANATYFGIKVNDQSLTPGPGARIAPTRFEEWLKRQ